MPIAMDKPELYNETNSFTREIAVFVLKEYASRIQWRKGDSIVDLGCCDGSVTIIMKKYVPDNYNKFVACDINKKMIDFANKHYSGENITFRKLDVEGGVPDDMRGGFNHLFSFLMLHWIQKQEDAFKTMYDLLSPGGDCLITFFNHIPVMYIYDYIARDKTFKWGTHWLKDISKMISIYLHMKHVDRYIRNIMTKIGFTDIDVQCKKRTYNFENALALKEITKAVEPYNMPDGVFDEFFQDFITVGKQHGILDGSFDLNDTTKKIPYEYDLVVVYARKPK